MTSSLALKKNIKTNFTAPKNCVLHWDSKIMTDQDKVVFDRLAVLVSVVPGFKEGKPLSVPAILDGTSQSQANKVFEKIEERGLSENISDLCFDTTASNTGWKDGVYVHLENHLKRKLLFLACRHHVFELLEGAAWKSVFGSSMSPDYAEFKQFQEKWPTLKNCKEQFKKLQIKDRKLISLKEETVSFLKMVLSEEKYLLLRGDYRECAEIILTMLGETSRRSSGEFAGKILGHFTKPGGCLQYFTRQRCMLLVSN